MKVSLLAGKPAEPLLWVNVPRLVTAYYNETPDPSAPEQRVAFGTSWHRGSSVDRSFNEWHTHFPAIVFQPAHPHLPYPSCGAGGGPDVDIARASPSVQWSG